MGASSGHGTVFNYHNGSAFVALGDVVSIAHTGMSREVLDSSTMDDSNYFRTFISGRADPGEIAVELNLIDSDTGHEALRDQLVDGAVSDALDQFQIEFPSSGTNWEFTGFLVSFEQTFNDGEKITASIKIKLSGKPTIT